jgi:putative peptidoglycan binding protein
MKSIHALDKLVVIAMAAALGGCSSWQTVDKTQGAMAGAASGALAGALVGGPIGAVVGGIGGAFVGHETTGYEGTATPATPATAAAAATPATTTTTTTQAATPMTAATATSAYAASTIRAVQQALNSRGYNAGAVDGQWNTATQDAVRRFQQVSGLPVTGDLNAPTLSALGVS